MTCGEVTRGRCAGRGRRDDTTNVEHRRGGAGRGMGYVPRVRVAAQRSHTHDSVCDSFALADSHAPVPPVPAPRPPPRTPGAPRPRGSGVAGPGIRRPGGQASCPNASCKTWRDTRELQTRTSRSIIASYRTPPDDQYSITLCRA